MRNLNVKLVSVSLLTAMMATGIPMVSFAAAFQDVQSGFWADRYIDYLTNRNVITGYPDNTFRPAQAVTRAEFAVMLAKSKNLPTGQANSSVFVDVPASHWAAQAIKSVADQGWIAGYPGSQFRPNQPISMAEMYTILSKVGVPSQVSDTQATQILNRFQDASAVPAWARVPVATAVQTGLDVSEITPTQLDPNLQASRASVATSMAKLLNESFRKTSGETVATQPQGERVNVTGTLQATARPGEWALVTSDNKRYLLDDVTAYKSQSWFKLGNRVTLDGNIDTQASTTTSTVVDVKTLAAVAPQENRIDVVGTLLPSTTTQGAWLVRTDSGQTYRLLDPSQYTGQSWFKYGNRVQLEGNTRPDVTLPTAEGTAVVISELAMAQEQQKLTLSGELQKTTEAGGWFVTDPATNKKYVLLGIDRAKTESWFREGTNVVAEGTVRTDVPNIYMEGPVLQVSAIQPHASSIQGAQQVNVYYPNRLNIVRDPLLQLGDPAARVLQGPNLPEKAVNAVLEGPNQVERVLGFYQDDAVKQLKLETLNIQPNGTATVILEAPANFTFSNSVVPQRLDEQLERTLRQFSGVTKVETAIQDPTNKVIWSSPTN